MISPSFSLLLPLPGHFESLNSSLSCHFNLATCSGFIFPCREWCTASASPNLFRTQTSTQLRPQSLSSSSSKSNHAQFTHNQHDKWQRRNIRRQIKIPTPQEQRASHFLTNPRVLDSIVKRAQILPMDTVLEIGSDTSNLTVWLLESAWRVIAVEVDGWW